MTDLGVQGSRRPRGRKSVGEFVARLERSRELVGFDAADAGWIESTHHLIADNADAIAGRLTSWMLAHPETQAYLLSGAGVVDWGLVAARRASLSGWLRLMACKRAEADVATWLMKTGRVHGRRGKGSGWVRARYIVAIVSVAQDCVGDVLMARLPGDDAMRATRAWGRLMTIHLDLLLAVVAAGETGSWY